MFIAIGILIDLFIWFEFVLPHHSRHSRLSLVIPHEWRCGMQRWFLGGGFVVDLDKWKFVQPFEVTHMASVHASILIHISAFLQYFFGQSMQRQILSLDHFEMLLCILSLT
jgi:hypothetical protein